jgi:Uma2 family endonuclease
MAIQTAPTQPMTTAAPAGLNGTQPQIKPAETELPRPLRWTLDEYYRLAEAGFFANRRVMLIEGEVYVMCPQNDPHAQGIIFSRDAVEAAFGKQFTYRTQMPMEFGLSTDPEPDVAILAGPPRSQPRKHPSTALLVIEVADTSLWYDTGDKASLYAAGGITDYWVVDINNGQLIVFRDPRPDAAAKFQHSYFQRTILARGESIPPLTAPNNPVAVNDLLP